MIGLFDFSRYSNSTTVLVWSESLAFHDDDAFLCEVGCLSVNLVLVVNASFCVSCASDVMEILGNFW